MALFLGKTNLSYLYERDGFATWNKVPTSNLPQKLGDKGGISLDVSRSLRKAFFGHKADKRSHFQKDVLIFLKEEEKLTILSLLK